ncbi:MAG TPA: hypothetical protein VNM22_02660 [Candidatus Limnocylindrales bacterium]|nr:hypothetical protein [Candidatus Limnocylindrales bacterium]
MRCANNHTFNYPAYDRESDSLICPVCCVVVEVTELSGDAWTDVTGGEIPLEEEVKDLQELVKILTLRIERLEKQVGIFQSSVERTLFRRIQAFFSKIFR